jgi:hypothetical protein
VVDVSHDATADSPIPGAESKPRAALRSTLEWGVIIVGALVAALLIKAFLMQAFYIPSASMEPTLLIGDRVLVNKLSYRLHDVNRGDIVVFKRPVAAPADAGDVNIKDLIKRVIALPGSTSPICPPGSPPTVCRSRPCRPATTGSWATTAGTPATAASSTRSRAASSRGGPSSASGRSAPSTSCSPSGYLAESSRAATMRSTWSL